MACNLLGAGDTTKEEIVSESGGEKCRTEDNQRNLGVQKYIRHLNKQINKQGWSKAHIPCEIKEENVHCNHFSLPTAG